MGHVDNFQDFEVAFRTIETKIKQHDCPTPTKGVIFEMKWAPGTVIQCKECDTNHVLADDQRDGLHWQRMLTK